MDQRPLPFKLLIVFTLILGVYLVFGQTLKYGFIHLDDDLYVIDNPHVREGITREGIVWAFTKPYAGFWIPLTWFSLMVDFHLYGMNPNGFHLTNMLLHTINVILLFLILEWMTGALWQSAFVAALFALHPLQVESVVWITERKDVLSTLFLLLTLWAYVRYSKRPSKKGYLLLFLTFLMGLMTKPMLVTIPIVLLLLDYWPLRRVFAPDTPRKLSFVSARITHLVVEKAPLFFLSALFGLLTLYAHRLAGGLQPLDQLPFWARMTNAPVFYVCYLGKILWPSRLGILYPHPGVIPVWQSTSATLLLVVMSVLIAREFRRPYLLTGWLWFLVTLTPVIGLAQAGVQSMADRFTYVPIIGFALISAWGIPDMLARWRYRKVILPLSACSVLIAMMCCSWAQAGYWKDSLTLFGHTLEITENNWLIHNNIGVFLFKQGRVEEAIPHFRTALQIKPDYTKALNNLGVSLVSKGEAEEALAHYHKALEIYSDNAEVYSNAGIAYEMLGKIEDAEAYYARAIEIMPGYGRAHYQMGNLLFKLGRFDEAVRHYTRFLEQRPDSAEVRLARGSACILTGDREGAEREYMILRQLDPRFAHILLERLSTDLRVEGEGDGSPEE